MAAILIAAGATRAADEPRARSVEDPLAPEHPLEVGAGLDLNRVLRQARSRDCDTVKIAANVAALGTDVLPAAMVLLHECKLPAIDGGDEQVMNELQEQALLEAMATWKPGFVWAAIDSSLATPEGELPTPSVRRAAVLAAGTCALPEDLRRIAGLALLASEDDLDARMERALRISVERIYGRRPEGLARLAFSWREFRPQLLPALLKAAGARGDPRALDLFAQVLDQAGDLEAITLAELSRQRAPLEIPSGLSEELRERLDPAQPMICQSASTVLGSLGDFESVEALIDLLSSSSAGVRTTAHRALCTMSGLALPPQAVSWNTWKVREREWFRKREAKLSADITGGTERQAREALEEISVHRWERHRLNDIVAQALARPEESIKSQACSVLGQLASPRARAILEDALRSDDSSCTLAAKAALAKCATL